MTRNFLTFHPLILVIPSVPLIICDHITYSFAYCLSSVLEHKFHEGKAFINFIHPCIFEAWSNAWQRSVLKKTVLVEWMGSQRREGWDGKSGGTECINTWRCDPLRGQVWLEQRVDMGAGEHEEGRVRLRRTLRPAQESAGWKWAGKWRLYYKKCSQPGKTFLAI